MQDHQKHRPQDDFGRPDRDDGRWEAQDRRADERVSWSEGDGGRTADAYRHQGQPDRSYAGSRGMGYGRDQQSRYGEGVSTGWTGDRSQGERGGFARGGYDPGYNQGGQFGGSPMGGPNDRGGYSQGYGQNYGPRDTGYSQHGYAPGGQIWEGSGRDFETRNRSGSSHHDFEPDYLHWRDQQLSNFDKDYSDWRSERRQKFSADFDTWRQNRPRTDASGHTLADNPIVGDVSDGGVGTQDAKKR